MTTFLALETTTHVCGVALFVDGVPVVERQSDRPKSHAAELVPMISECLKEKDLVPNDLQAIAVSAGPGSYTGLRIGVSTAKGLVYATAARIVAVSTLKAIAYSYLKSTADVVVPVLPSRSGEVYLAAYQSQGALGFVQRVPECTIFIDDIQKSLEDAGIKRGTVVGPEANQLSSALDTLTSFDFKDETASAKNVGMLAISRIENELFEDTSNFEPYYLRAFEARKPARSIFDRLPF